MVWGRWQGRGPWLFSWRGRHSPEHEQRLVWLLTVKCSVQASSVLEPNVLHSHWP